MRDLLVYDPATGVITWRVDQGTAKAGQVAGYKRPDGYTIISVGRKRYYLHRIAWYLMTGAWPEAEIDHIDHDPDNNAWENLRDVSHSQNGLHRAAAQSNNRHSNIVGVSWNDRLEKWHARRKRVHLGFFENFDDAVAARVAAQ